jgi:hypothetical protein
MTANESAKRAQPEGQPASDGAEATRPDDKEKRVTPGDEKGAEPAAWRALTKHWPCEGDEEWRYGPWVEGLDRSRFEPLYTHPPRGPDSAREALTEAAKRIEAIEQAAAYVAGCLPSQEMAHAASRLRQLCSDFRWWCRAALTGGKARDE